jgi:hypothetical protein
MITKRCVVIISCFISFVLCQALPQEAREKGFVYLHEVDPTIIISP